MSNFISGTVNDLQKKKKTSNSIFGSFFYNILIVLFLAFIVFIFIGPDLISAWITWLWYKEDKRNNDLWQNEISHEILLQKKI